MKRIRNCRHSRSEPEGVMRALEGAMRSDNHSTDPILEQLKQCPEAFKVGEILGKAFDSLKYGQEGEAVEDRLLPSPGAIVPPLV